ncbi:MAG: hypothetical protein GC162_14840 [Planctomycetes bacterium]|nr:hypothetical protein [Planctomycetota bacterium]
MQHTPIRFIVALAAVLFLHTVAFAQSNAALMIKPWTEGQAGSVNAQFVYQGSSHTRDAARNDFSLQRYEATGRFRFNTTDEHSPAVGFNILQYQLDSPDPRLPERLSDQSFAVGFGVGKYEDWEFGLTAGVGFAGDNPYGDSNGFYAKADFIASRKINADESLQLFLNYNGNRTFLPDVPLPGVAFNHRVSDELTYTAGLPFSSIKWQPGAGPWTLRASYAIPFTVDAAVEYAVTDTLSLQASFHNDFNAFHIDRTDDHTRLFFEQRRIEAGLRWTACRNCTLDLAAGYAFSQKFSTGFDSRDLDTLLKVSNAPYARVGIDLWF